MLVNKITLQLQAIPDVHKGDEIKTDVFQRLVDQFNELAEDHGFEVLDALLETVYKFEDSDAILS